MNILTVLCLFVVLANVGLAQAAPPNSEKNPVTQAPSKPQMGLPVVKPPIPPTPAPGTTGLHIHHVGLYAPSGGQPLHFRVQIQNPGARQRIVGQIEIRSEDGSQRVTQAFNEGELGGVLARLPFQITSCGSTPQCFRAGLVMEPDGAVQWDGIEARVCVTSRCTFEVTPATSREQY